MNIEITQKTFNLIFNEINDFIKIEQKELFVKNTFYNKYYDQKGFSVYNYITGFWQYYLIDINA